MKLNKITTRDVEEFLYREAELLDSRRLTEWRELLTEDCHYYVPACDTPAGASADKTLFYIADDGSVDRADQAPVEEDLSRRISALEGASHREQHPLVEVGEEEAQATACFVTYRHQRGNQDIYVGRHHYRFVIDKGALKMREKTSTLHLEALRPHGRITLIV